MTKLDITHLANKAPNARENPLVCAKRAWLSSQFDVVSMVTSRPSVDLEAFLRLQWVFEFEFST